MNSYQEHNHKVVDYNNYRAEQAVCCVHGLGKVHMEATAKTFSELKVSMVPMAGNRTQPNKGEDYGNTTTHTNRARRKSGNVGSNTRGI